MHIPIFCGDYQFLWGQTNAVVINIHAAITRAGGDLFSPVGMPVKPGLSNKEFQPAAQSSTDQINPFA